MSMNAKKMVGIVIMVFLGMVVSGCGAVSKTSIDYGDAAVFEAALNAVENLEGKVVQFVALELHPDSALGYNVWAGEHLNFVSGRNPDIKAGDTAVVKAVTIESSLGSWIITYEKVADAQITDATIFSNGGNPDEAPKEDAKAAADSGVNVSSEETKTETNETKKSASFSVGNSSAEEKALPLQIVDYGWYIDKTSSYSDSMYVDFCAMIYNPNQTQIAEFPKAIVTVKNGDGSILATEDQTGSIVMPQDTVTLCGSFSMPAGSISDDAQIVFDVDWSEFTTKSYYHEAVRTTDFTFSNVSERSGRSDHYITGEITNNSSEDVDTVCLSIVLRKDDKIVYMDNTFVHGLKAGKTMAFEMHTYDDVPAHDVIDCSAMIW